MNMEKRGPHEFETFSKCIESEFGPDMERKILTNVYTNYGDTKNIFDYMFSNLYSEKTTKLVKLNLETDINNIEENQSEAEAAARNVELKKKLAKLKNKIEQENLDTASLCKTIVEQEKSLQKAQNDYKNKEISSMAQEVFIKKTQDLNGKFEIALNISGLNFITSAENNHQNIEGLENISKSNSFKKINLNEASDYFIKKINEESKKIHQITNKSHLNNEIDLILYQLDSNSTDRSRPNLNISERINENYMENIRLDCEIKKWSKEKSLVAAESKELKLKLSEYLTNNYKDESLQMYATYLSIYLKYKQMEFQSNELKSALSFLYSQINALKEQTSSIPQKRRKLNDLMNDICVKQSELDQLLEENKKILNSNLYLHVSQIKQTAELLVCLINSFNADQFNTTKGDITFQSNSTISNLTMQSEGSINSKNGLLHAFQRFNSKFKLESNQSIEEFTSEDKDSFKKLFNYVEFMDQKGLFEKFIHVFQKLKSKLTELEKLTRNQSRFNQVGKLTVELNESLEKCQEFDKIELFQYIELLMETVDETKALKPEILELEKLIKVLQIQPGAYQCIPDDLTVNGKKLGYYCDMLDKTIAHTERMTFGQSEHVYQQIRQLLQQFSSDY